MNKIIGCIKSEEVKVENQSKDIIVISEKYLGKILLIASVFYTLLVIFVSAMPLNITGKTLYITGGVVIFVNVLVYILGLHYYFYELRFDLNGVYYRKGIFGIHQYSMEQVISYEVSDNNKLVIRFADNNRAVVALTESSYRIINRLSKESVQHIRHLDKEPYIIKATKFYVVFSLICLCFFLIFMILCFSTYVICGGLMFAVFTFFSMVDFIKKVRDKVIVTGDDIVVKRAFKKTKYIRVSDIKSIRRKTVDKAEIVYIFGENDLLFKYSKLNTNSQRFEGVISKKTLKK